MRLGSSLPARGALRGNIDDKSTALYSSFMKKHRRIARNRARVERDDCRVMFSLMQAGHAVERRLEEALEEVGLSAAKFGVLTHLVRAGEPLSLGELTARMTWWPCKNTQPT